MLLQKNPQEVGPFLASKWQKFYLFLSPKEVENLFAFWSIDHLYLTGKVLERESLIVKNWIEKYANVLNAFWEGGSERNKLFSSILPAVISISEESLYRQDVSNGFLVHMKDPCFVLQEHWFRYVPKDEKIYPMNFTNESLFWGLQFSYPQIFQDSKTKKIYNANLESSFGNAKLLILLRKWIREHTKPVSLQVGEMKHSTLFRIGKEYIKKIEDHSQIKEFGKVNVH